ncbi:hypothetical protein AB1Y20_014385 [Prymnesium parvum]|uniref:Uncharacterized protein n=1 Tax=Prymnesium parvum TaxID=97485 RepID=A0AB34IFP5_PRYPA
MMRIGFVLFQQPPSRPAGRMKRIRVTATARSWTAQEVEELDELRGLQAKLLDLAAAKLQRLHRARAARQQQRQAAAATLQLFHRRRVAAELAWLAAFAAAWHASVTLQRHARGALCRARRRREAAPPHPLRPARLAAVGEWREARRRRRPALLEGGELITGGEAHCDEAWEVGWGGHRPPLARHRQYTV